VAVHLVYIIFLFNYLDAKMSLWMWYAVYLLGDSVKTTYPYT
jgi:hypothetical protein